MIKLESNVFYYQNINNSTDPYIHEQFCLIRTNENMLNLAYDNNAYLDIPCLPAPIAELSPPEGSVCWTAGWGGYRERDEFGNLGNFIHNQEKSIYLDHPGTHPGIAYTV